MKATHHWLRSVTGFLLLSLPLPLLTHCYQAAAPPPAAPTSATVGPAGGTFDFAGGIRLVVPANALRAAVTISVTPTQTPPGFTALSPVARFEPAGATFLAPVEVTFPVSGDTSKAFVLWTNESGDFGNIGGNRDTSAKITTYVDRLGTGFIGTTPFFDTGMCVLTHGLQLASVPIGPSTVPTPATVYTSIYYLDDECNPVAPPGPPTGSEPDGCVVSNAITIASAPIAPDTGSIPATVDEPDLIVIEVPYGEDPASLCTPNYVPTPTPTPTPIVPTPSPTPTYVVPSPSPTPTYIVPQPTPSPTYIVPTLVPTGFNEVQHPSQEARHAAS